MAANSNDRTGILRMYVNDMVALERHLHDAVRRQQEDEHVKAHADTIALVNKLHATSHQRLHTMEELAKSLGGEGAGGVLKEAVSAAAGTLAGLYDKVRKHPVSRLLRDDYTAHSLVVTAYSMLHTTGLALGNQNVADTALRHLKAVPPLIIELTGVIPAAVVRELAEDDPAVDRSAEETARNAAYKAWTYPA